jgi:hypothetical protein
MIEKFDNRSKQAGEFLEIPQRLQILADAIIDTVGHDLAGYEGNVKRVEWNDPRTNTRIELQKQLEEENTKYYIEEFNTTDDESDIEWIKEFFFSSRNGYKTRLLASDHKTFISSDQDPAPGKELLGILTYGPVDAAPLLNRHEENEIKDRFQRLVGNFAIDHSKVIRNKIYGAYRRKDPLREVEALANIADMITLYGEISTLQAYNAIESFREYHVDKINKKTEVAKSS